MTTQEAYERIRGYLTREGAVRAVDPVNGRCQYFTEIKGVEQRCAVGCLLSEDTARKFCDYGGVWTLTEERQEAQEELEGVDISFLSGAQRVHDDARNWGREFSDDGGRVAFNVALIDAEAKLHGLKVVAS